jgi:hypothetical protein
MKKLTILIAAIALVCFSVPAMAVDWSFYGNARMATFWESRDFGDGLNAAGTDDGDQGLIWDLHTNSRLGANIKAESIKAQVELAVKSAGGGGDVSSRRIYGVWDFGAGKLKIGKDYTPVSQFISGQVYDGDLGLLGIGTAYGNREAQIALSFGAFDIALVHNRTGLIEGMDSFAGFTFLGDNDSIVPKLELGWGMSFDTWNFKLMGGAQYYSIEDVTSETDRGDTNDIDVTSYIIGGDVGWNFGPGYVKGAVSYGQNTGNAGWSIPSGVNGRSGTYQGGLAMWDGDDDSNDTYTAMAAIAGGMKVSDMLSFEAGFGYRKDQTDSGFQRDTAPWAVYVQSVVALAPGVYIIPEVGYYDLDNNVASDDAGSLFYLGAKWQINF